MTARQRSRSSQRSILRLPALEVRQGGNRTLYSFAVDGKKLSEFATVSRVHRDDNAHIQGYQRPEVLSHISSIRRYIESEDPMIPNALVVAFDKRVTFEPDRLKFAAPTLGLARSLFLLMTNCLTTRNRAGLSMDSSAARQSARHESNPSRYV